MDFKSKSKSKCCHPNATEKNFDIFILVQWKLYIYIYYICDCFYNNWKYDYKICYSFVKLVQFAKYKFNEITLKKLSCKKNYHMQYMGIQWI